MTSNQLWGIAAEAQVIGQCGCACGWAWFCGRVMAWCTCMSIEDRCRERPTFEGHASIYNVILHLFESNLLSALVAALAAI